MPGPEIIRPGTRAVLASKGEYAGWRATRAAGDFDLRTFAIRASPARARQHESVDEFIEPSTRLRAPGVLRDDRNGADTIIPERSPIIPRRSPCPAHPASRARLRPACSVPRGRENTPSDARPAGNEPTAIAQKRRHRDQQQDGMTPAAPATERISLPITRGSDTPTPRPAGRFGRRFSSPLIRINAPAIPPAVT